MFPPSGRFSCSLLFSLLGTPKGHQPITHPLTTNSPWAILLEVVSIVNRVSLQVQPPSDDALSGLGVPCSLPQLVQGAGKDDCKATSHFPQLTVGTLSVRPLASH